MAGPRSSRWARFLSYMTRSACASARSSDTRSRIRVDADRGGEELDVGLAAGPRRLFDLVDLGRKHVEAPPRELFVHARQDHEEFVAAPADDVVVAADELLDAVGDRPDRAVALLVALFVVDALQSVDVDQDDGAARLALLELRPDLVEEEPVVRLGQRVEPCLALRPARVVDRAGVERREAPLRVLHRPDDQSDAEEHLEQHVEEPDVVQHADSPGQGAERDGHAGRTGGKLRRARREAEHDERRELRAGGQQRDGARRTAGRARPSGSGR